MLIVVDKKIPNSAKEKLSELGELFELKSSGIVYPEISGHPDIFMCQTSNGLIVAPNAPDELIAVLNKNKISFKFGQKNLAAKYPETSYYNAVSNSNIFIHNLSFTDSYLLSAVEEQKKISVNQGYCRCNLLALDTGNFVCSDSGILKTLKNNNYNVFFVSPKKIRLPGFSYGFFGGATGIYHDKVFLIGSLNFLEEGRDLKKWLESQNYQIIELYNGPLFDGGSIIFLETN